MMCETAMSEQFRLPTLSFIAGETQDILFNTYFLKNSRPFDLSGCTCNFSLIGFTGRTGTPILSKAMDIVQNEDGSAENVLSVTLTSSETLELGGKYIYQLQIKGPSGEVEIPSQGLMYITNNINKDFLRG